MFFFVFFIFGGEQIVFRACMLNFGAAIKMWYTNVLLYRPGCWDLWIFQAVTSRGSSKMTFKRVWSSWRSLLFFLSWAFLNFPQWIPLSSLQYHELAWYALQFLCSPHLPESRWPSSFMIDNKFTSFCISVIHLQMYISYTFISLAKIAAERRKPNMAYF